MRKKFLFASLLACFLACASGCASSAPRTITQVSTIDAVLAGSYDGVITCRELLSYGDFGIGTFHGLDGEMILLDGIIYQVRADGKVYKPPMNMTTPFAAVTGFKKDLALEVARGTDFEGLAGTINEAAPNLNLFTAVKVRGDFLKMKTRSVPAQSKPYPPLVEVTRHQPFFELENVSGTIVGFRTPEFAKGIAVPGFHLHFISDDAESGGHVLDFITEDAIAEINVCNRFLLVLPAEQCSFADLDLSADRSAELEEAER